MIISCVGSLAAVFHRYPFPPAPCRSPGFSRLRRGHCQRVRALLVRFQWRVKLHGKNQILLTVEIDLRARTAVHHPSVVLRIPSLGGVGSGYHEIGLTRDGVAHAGSIQPQTCQIGDRTHAFTGDIQSEGCLAEKYLFSVMPTLADCGIVRDIVPEPGVTADIKKAEPDSIKGDPFQKTTVVVALYLVQLTAMGSQGWTVAATF